MSLKLVRRGRSTVGEFEMDLAPGDRLEVLDDTGQIVLSLAPEPGDREHIANTGDTTTHRAFLHVAKDVLVCDQRGTSIAIAGVRLQLDH